METLNATEAKREFGDVLLKVQHSPIGINKNGKPIAVVVSAAEYEELNALKEQWLKAELQKGMEDLKAGRIKEREEVFNNLRNRIINTQI